MKTSKILKLVVALSLSFFNSCSSDNSPAEKLNEIKVNEKQFEIVNATISESNTFDGVTEFDLYLASSGLTVNSSNYLTGKGDYLYLRLFSSSETELSAGNYVYNDQDSNSFLINSSVHFFNYDSELGDGQSGDVDIELGSVSVAVENGKYIITVNLTDENDARVTGYYSGTIEGFNE